MSYELYISSTNIGCRLALLKEKKLVEFHDEAENNQFTVGDIFLGRVKRITDGLNAAFIDIGSEKDAFLHYLDLGPQVKSLNKFIKQVQNNNPVNVKLSGFKSESDINKLGKMPQVLSTNQRVLVQIVKEPISSKGPRITSELSLAGRYLVLVPFSSNVNISKKITNNDERKRLLRLINSIKPENFGIIVRTVAENKEVKELAKDLNILLDKWVEGMKLLKTASPRTKIIGEVSRTNSLLRDILNESFDSIHVDDKSLFNEVKTFLNTIAPEKEKILKLYNGKVKIFEQYGIEKQIKALFGKSVPLISGGYLIIEHTEALHVIDVNSGSKVNKEENQDNTAINVNIQAAKEIARQLRLRDMGGIIVVDFIDVRSQDSKKLIYNTIKKEMESDRSKHTILPLSKFNLLQITRQRVRPELKISTLEKCPSCNGTGNISPSILVADEIEKAVTSFLGEKKEKKIALLLHPYLDSYFTKGVISKQMKWFLKYFKWVPIIADSSLGITNFSIFNDKGEELNVKTAPEEEVTIIKES